MPEVVEPVVPVAPKKDLKRIELKIERKGGKTLFSFKVDPAFTRIYDTGDAVVKNSNNWPGLQFYKVPSIINSPEYMETLRHYGLFDDFGQPLMQQKSERDVLMNIAWIRTVGGQGEIEVREQITVAELSKMIKSATAFMKDFFEEVLGEAVIKGTVTMDI